jgi:hypothetical protein
MDSVVPQCVMPKRFWARREGEMRRDHD